MDLKTLHQQFDEQGVVVIPQVLDKVVLSVLQQELETAIAQDKQQRPEVFDSGMVHNCMVRGEQMLALLDHSMLNHYIKALFTPHCIIYAYQSSSLAPGKGNYGSRIHVDCPRWIANYTSNIGVILPLNDFTPNNGATFYLPGSHRLAELPTEQTFYQQAKRLVCQAGDMVVFNARLIHAAGVNHDNYTRHALTINLCRPYMRQRFDFPRLLTKQQIDRLGEDGRRLIGMNVRMPVSLEEFYLPPDQRLYKPGQE
ncbi:MAG: phytanoyl-CoA dioxygenase family protein [Gammaproteobacteria bacterium]|nr:phytanoyl-CoA dioxygenase family protein [Gammaproteobacteria bacterium]